MANFEIFWPKLKVYEGGYVNDPDDDGGETYRGISRKYFPKWEGWATIDKLKAKSPIKKGTIISTLENAVKVFFKTNFWNKVNGDNIQSQAVADLYADWFVNSEKGAKTAMNDSLKKLGVTNINAADPRSLHSLLIDKRIIFYNKRAKAKPKNIKYLDGWLKRVNQFAKDIPAAKVGMGVGSVILLIGGFFLLNSKYHFLKPKK